MKARLLLATALLGLIPLVGTTREPIRLPNNPALAPDGKTIAFDYLGDIWTVPLAGGTAKPLTQHTGRDTSPKFSPDGSQLAFVSDREGNPQVFVMPSNGGTPRQVTFHTAGFSLHEWTADGRLLVSSVRDHFWRHGERFYLVNPKERKAEEHLFDDYGASGTLSVDGKMLAFTREGEPWWRKGYKGSRSVQLWLYGTDTKKFAPLVKEEVDARWPMWRTDGSALYFVSGRGGVLNLWEKTLSKNGSGSERQITKFTEDAVVFPCISRDGSTIVFRNLFDLYRLTPGKDEKPTKIEIFRDDDRPAERMERRTLASANSAAFTNDGLEIAIAAGGDIWVMDTELREPKRITKSSEEERSPIFAPDGQSILFVSDAGGTTDIVRAVRTNPKKPWWLNDNFKLEKVTTDGEPKSGLSFSPDGSKFAYIRGRGNLWVADSDGKNPKLILEGWNAPAYDWSPDGKWLVYALYDNDFNRDIWIKPIDGSRAPFNLSRHPFNEDFPVWSPDGKVIAFVGSREQKGETDIFFVFLRAEDDQKGSREKILERALEKIQKGRTPAFPKKESDSHDEDGQPEQAPQPKLVKGDEKDPKDKEPKVIPKKTVPEVVIDFEGIKDRTRRVSIPNSNEGGLFWSPDSRKLAFAGSVGGQSGTYTIDVPDGTTPTQLSSQTGSGARWLRNGQIVWLSGGLPGSISGTAAPTLPTAPTTPTPKFGPRTGGTTGGSSAAAVGGYRFTAYQDIDIAKRNQAAFDMCWRTMRDNWYDDRLGNKNWSAVRAKYLPVAETTDNETLTTIVQLMLGELNGSHLGFFAGSTTLPTRRPTDPPGDPTSNTGRWSVVTSHLGVRFDNDHRGAGLKVRDVIPGGPAELKKSELFAGDVILSIDGTKVDTSMDITTVLNGLSTRDVRLTVQSKDGKEREVVIRPISPTIARGLLYRAWLKHNQRMVDDLSKNTLGYLHISAMDMGSFYKFEEELYNAGAGKDGLVIDVRENGGGSTADHLLTALTQPRHAIAVPRGGGQGYPQDRTVYATWNKPIIVLCNQNSYSNAEIFSHAVKTLKRGKVVGVPTAGGVISTGGVSIMDVGFLRLPFRGWYLINDGEDMELHGAVPDVIIWPEPGELPKGKDTQLSKAVELLLNDVQDWKNRPQPKLRKATER